MNTFLKSIFTLIIFGFMLSPLVSSAQSKPAKGPKDPAQRVEDRSQRLKTELGLTDDQVAKVKAAMTEHQSNMDEVKKMTDETARKASGKAARQAFDDKMKSILTADQYTKFKAKEEERKKNGGGKPKPEVE